VGLEEIFSGGGQGKLPGKAVGGGGSGHMGPVVGAQELSRWQGGGRPCANGDTGRIAVVGYHRIHVISRDGLAQDGYRHVAEVDGFLQGHTKPIVFAQQMPLFVIYVLDNSGFISARDFRGPLTKTVIGIAGDDIVRLVFDALQAATVAVGIMVGAVIRLVAGWVIAVDLRRCRAGGAGEPVAVRVDVVGESVGQDAVARFIIAITLVDGGATGIVCQAAKVVVGEGLVKIGRGEGSRTGTSVGHRLDPAGWIKSEGAHQPT